MFYLYEELEFNAGQETYLDAQSSEFPYAIVFEDDGETAYLYALDLQKQAQPIDDALWIYNVQDLSDESKNVPSKVQLCWHKHKPIGLVFINNYPYVVFDFENKIGYSRSNFPEPSPSSGWQHEFLTDEFIEALVNE